MISLKEGGNVRCRKWSWSEFLVDYRQTLSFGSWDWSAWAGNVSAWFTETAPFYRVESSACLMCFSSFVEQILGGSAGRGSRPTNVSFPSCFVFHQIELPDQRQTNYNSARAPWLSVSTFATGCRLQIITSQSDVTNQQLVPFSSPIPPARLIPTRPHVNR